MEKAKGTEEESRKSSTCQPGRVSIKYWDIVEPPLPSSIDVGEGVVDFSIKEEEGIWFDLVVAEEGVDDEDEEDEFVVEILIPVRRNLSCFCVSSFTEWIDESQSLHRIALSCLHNTKALLS